tara:strand:- start:223 stop:1323 length:1101 start_codon:yes stop_codon:yes gene_type:complete
LEQDHEKTIATTEAKSKESYQGRNFVNLSPEFYETVLLELLNKIEINKNKNINYKSRIIELETELNNLRNKLAISFDATQKIQRTIQSHQEKESKLKSDWSIPLLLDLVEKATKDKQENIVTIELLKKENKKLLRDLELFDDQNEQVFIQLEEAIEVSIGPLKRMFRSLGLPTENIIDQIRNSYSGSGGLFDPATLDNYLDIDQLYNSKKSSEDLLRTIADLNFYRIAAETIPIYAPVQSSSRFASGFGFRKDPINGKRAMHHGADFAAPKGTPIYAAANGIVSYAGWYGGYGLLVIIKHGFGYETRYAHNSRIRVKVGERVSRGDRISDMGSTGRSTGSHLHYEVRRNNKPINPMTYIKAGRYVF